MADGSVIHLPDHSQRGHSDLGASGAERWMNCHGSVALIAKFRAILAEMGIPEEDDPDYRREGTAMHEASDHCLKTGCDTWEITGQTFNETVIDEVMARAIQVYLDECRRDIDRSSFHYVEYRISSPKHKDFYGTADFVAFVNSGVVPAATMSEVYGDNFWLLVRDLKGGEGIIVEPEDNPQLKYYAFGVIDTWERSSGVTLHPQLKVRLSICQPRAWHESGLATREWDTTVGEIKTWVDDVLIPEMNATAVDGNLAAGDWCRFCPAKLVCPLLTGLFRAAATHNPAELVNADDEAIGRSFVLSKGVKFYLKALEEETFRRLNAGRTMEGQAKLVPKKSNRVYKAKATVLNIQTGDLVEVPIADAIKSHFGQDAFTKPELKSPAELEKLSPAAKEFVKEHAYMPSTGLTVALWSDPKAGVKVTTAQEAFATAIANLTETIPAGPLDTRPSKGPS